ncbi:hypothetical protein KPL74_18885 [Bacillus sp. NP157]|nr:hypothetical protein KPL74_18885 [Bacillus sp. NP157]
MRRLLIALATSACTLSAHAMHATALPPPDPAMAAIDILLNKGDPWHDYVALRARLAGIPASTRHPALDPFAQADTLFGRYADATRHYLEYAPNAAAPIACPGTPWHRSGLDALPALIGDARVVVINEAHIEPATRATVIALLPALRKMGFRHIALEALVTGKAEALGKRGYAHDDTEAAVYLREPVFAELIREAAAQGFDFVAYDQPEAANGGREAASAALLKAWLDAHPGEKLLVQVGYAHVRREQGWLAERLSKLPGLAMVTIDQVSGIRGCAGDGAVAAAPSVWTQAGKGWSLHPALIDITLTWARDDRRGAANSWMTLGGQRREVTLPSSTCGGKRPCLVEALVPGEDKGVPADRLGLAGKNEQPILYLKPGNYALRVTAGSSAPTTTTLTVPPL